MTNDLISREMALELARNHINRTIDCNDIARIPAVDAAPVVCCEFERLKETKFPSLTVMPLRCGACGAEFAVLFRDVPGNVEFCPECGCARMDNEADNAQE